MVRVASQVTVDASAFFAAHRSAYQLCANGVCVTPQVHSPRPAVVFLAVDGASELHVRIRITDRQSAVLLEAAADVPVRHVVFDAACGIEADLGTVKVARAGALLPTD